MEPLLLLVHRIPFPPNKGDKIRSYHLLRFLTSRFRVHVGTFIDSDHDREHLPALAKLATSCKVVSIRPRWARLRSLAGLVTGEALTLPYYRSAELQRWVDETVASQGIRSAIVFSSAMAQYVARVPGLQAVFDFVDVDSAKWAEYSERRAWPVSLIFRREGRMLLKFERQVAASSSANVFVSRGEADLFLRLAPEARDRVHVVENGVDSSYFCPQADRATPFEKDELPIVFTGSMDYWPNVDAVTWFADAVFPSILEKRPDARFYIVGMNPAPAVQALARRRQIVVTGRVADVRPYLQYAAVVVAPLRIARGVQNKVLEAMAMGRPVVVSEQAACGIAGSANNDFLEADSAQEFSHAVLSVLDGRAAPTLGASARRTIVAACNWDRNMSKFGELLGEKSAAPVACAV